LSPGIATAEVALQRELEKQVAAINATQDGQTQFSRDAILTGGQMLMRTWWSSLKNSVFRSIWAGRLIVKRATYKAPPVAVFGAASVLTIIEAIRCLRWDRAEWQRGA